jgi:CcmD family protein
MKNKFKMALGAAALLWVALCLPSWALAAKVQPNFELMLRDSAGQPVHGRQLQLQVEITTGSFEGETQYAETHEAYSSNMGVVGIAIGQGKPTDPKYDFDKFDISQGKNFVRIFILEGNEKSLYMSTQMPNVPSVRKWLFADEKSNTVIAVMVAIWLGILVYLLLTARKIKRLEARISQLKQGGGQNS